MGFGMAKATMLHRALTRCIHKAVLDTSALNYLRPTPGYKAWYDRYRGRWHWAREVDDGILTWGHGSAPDEKQAHAACIAHSEAVQYYRGLRKD